MYSRRETTETQKKGCLADLGLKLSKLAIIMGLATSLGGAVVINQWGQRAEEKERLLRESKWRATRVSKSTAKALKEAGFEALLLRDPRDGSYYVKQVKVDVGQYDENRPPVRLEPRVREEIKEVGLEEFITPSGDLKNVSGGEILTRENPYLMFRVPDDVYQKFYATEDEDVSGALAVRQVEPGMKQIKVRNESREQDIFRQFVSEFYEEPKKKAENIFNLGLFATGAGVLIFIGRFFDELERRNRRLPER